MFQLQKLERWLTVTPCLQAHRQQYHHYVQKAPLSRLPSLLILRRLLQTALPEEFWPVLSISWFRTGWLIEHKHFQFLWFRKGCLIGQKQHRLLTEEFICIRVIVDASCSDRWFFLWWRRSLLGDLEDVVLTSMTKNPSCKLQFFQRGWYSLICTLRPGSGINYCPAYFLCK